MDLVKVATDAGEYYEECVLKRNTFELIKEDLNNIKIKKLDIPKISRCVIDE